MFSTRTFAAAVLASATIAAAASPALAIVPGSDTYRDAQDTAAIMSVIDGATVGQPNGRSTFGYPASGQPVPPAAGDTESNVANTDGETALPPAGSVRNGGGRLVPASGTYY